MMKKFQSQTERQALTKVFRLHDKNDQIPTKEHISRQYCKEW